MKTIIFLCTGNSCRSQMAEGWLRHLAGNRFTVYSAGTSPSGQVHPNAVLVMHEAEIDISGHHSKSLESLSDIKPDIVITVCDAANETCPVYPGSVMRLHWSFPDPPHTGDSEEVINEFRTVRDAIRDRLQTALQSNEL